MKKFIVLYYAPASAAEQMKNASPEEMQKGMEPWMAWAKKCGSALVDLGTPLGNGQRLSKSGGSSPSQSNIVGYSILQAENMEGAKALLQDHPHLHWAEGCEIEVHESLPLPM
ncbi:MAG: hypothetical protein AAB524_02535 [Patescibacteria group bacterium]